MRWTKYSLNGKATPLKNLRAHTMTLVADKLIIFGGCDAKICYNEVYIIDPETMHVMVFKR